jgi:S-DNA-T family DNA segregation ATPase FtsK/SpoIIIE
VGALVGTLEIPFGNIAAIVLMATFFIASLLLTFNLAIRIPRRRDMKKDESAEKPLTVINSGEVVATPAAVGAVIAPPAAPEQREADADEEIEVKIAKPKEEVRSSGKATVIPRVKSAYVPPPLELLKTALEKPTAGDLRANANIIKRTLDGFGIPVEMGEINIGPKVTRYTLKPAEGVKLTRILALNQDLSLALAAHPIRIEAPIPGKSLVGIEVPNKAVAIVRLGNLLGLQEFAAAEPLAFALGRNVSGEAVFANIERMPHLLIAGSTGSGKSVMIHSLILSLLYKNSPEALRLILIDPKRVELSVYEGIPHLVAPVVTETKKSVTVFRWAIREMERRYELLLRAGARDIQGYNKTAPAETLPYLVIVIDELADLMTSYGREVEGSIVRLAQMARATGLHLVLSTQRPSVEVITGLIKANITYRIALQVASQIDSRTILDSAGAEKLLGGGDLLFISAESSKPKRIQGAYMSEDEIKHVVEFIADHNEPVPYAGPTLENGNGGNAGEEGLNGALFDEYDGDGNDDPLYAEAVAIVREAKKASASFLQRRLRVGYARAARLLDLMEEQGIIGPGDGAKPREILE